MGGAIMGIQRALISVSDKTGVVDLARELVALGVEIISTGGTARVLDEAEVSVTEVSELTGYPELFNGRVKTLHPAIHGGILFQRQTASHCSEMQELGIEPIDLVVVNLYPFEQATTQNGLSTSEVIEQIDIGGPALLRSAAKNHVDVIVVCDPRDYKFLVCELKLGSEFKMELRQKFAAKVFSHTSRYDFQIEKYFKKVFLEQEIDQVRIEAVKRIERYGENPHQEASVGLIEGSKPPSVGHATQLRGIPLSYNNYLDGDAALQTLLEFQGLGESVAVVVKHGNPCGIAIATSQVNALERAWQGDSVSAFGSVMGLNQELSLATAKALCDRMGPSGRRGWFVEMILAPSFSTEAVAYLDSKKSKSKLRLLETGSWVEMGKISQIRTLGSTVLIQSQDRDLYLASSPSLIFERARARTIEDSAQKQVGVVSRQMPSQKIYATLDFAFRACKQIKSNAISIARRIDANKIQLLGMGSGQPNRKDSASLALQKARSNLSAEYRLLAGDGDDSLHAILESETETLLKYGDSLIQKQNEEEYIRSQLRENCAVGSDAFFPFSDGVEELLAWDLRHFIQPGGSLRDQDIVETVDGHQAVMLFTGMRHFRH
jgi:phosphoribosylaminoimidazolecarboxamide formyltransferase / IMP cyclohydrolase